MLEGIFDFLYSLVLGYHETYENEYVTDIFPMVGLMMILASAALSAIFYLVLNRTTAKYSTSVYWILFLVLNAIIAFVYAIVKAKEGTAEVSTDNYMILFAAINAAYSVVFYFIFSLIFRKFSLHAERTPF